MDIFTVEVPDRAPEDLAAEGMWRIVAGQSCQEHWEDLPADEKQWWKNCAMYAIREWLGGLRPNR
jgi:hypothetical protein